MKKFDDLTFSDHYMFEKVLQNKEICKEILERLLKINITHIEYPEIEKEISPYYETKGVRLDVYVKDKDEVFDIELQNFMDVSIPLRSRYYQSILDMDNLIKGEYYSELPTSYIIFICSFDPFYKELPMYTFTTHCEEDNTLIFEDKIIKKVFNAKAYTKEKDVAIKAFLEYICNKKPVDDLTDKIDSVVKIIKQQEVNRKEYNTVNIHDQDSFLRGKKEGISQGAEQAKLETAKKLLQNKIPLEIILESTGISNETLQFLVKEMDENTY